MVDMTSIIPYFRNGNWSSPVNFGPGINTSSDEYRPLIGYHSDFSEYLYDLLIEPARGDREAMISISRGIESLNKNKV